MESVPDRWLSARIEKAAYLRGGKCWSAALGGSLCSRPASHVVFFRDRPYGVCSYHAGAANRIGEGAYKLSAAK